MSTAGNASIIRRLRRGGVLFDGGMGSMLISNGLSVGLPPEEWNLSHAAIVSEVHSSYLKAGAEVISTNTFGGTPTKLAGYGLSGKTGLINQAGVELAKEAVRLFEETTSRPSGNPDTAGGDRSSIESKFVAFSMGPTGMMMPPVGTAEPSTIAAEFRSQIQAAGTAMDLILIETVYDLREGLLALKEAGAAADIPAGITLTVDKKPKGFFTIMGDEIQRAIEELENAGADLVGVNCTLTSEDMVELSRIVRRATDLPVLCQPNAGQPVIRNGIPEYGQPPESFAADLARMFDAGINAGGGCCGTTPDFVRTAKTELNKRAYRG